MEIKNGNNTGSMNNMVEKVRSKSDGVIIMPKVPEDIEATDFSRNLVEIIDNCCYMDVLEKVAPEKIKEILVCRSMDLDKILIWMETV